MQHGEEFLAYLRDVRVYSARTAHAYGVALKDFERVLLVDDPAIVKPHDFDRYLTLAALRGVAPSTRRARLFQLKRFFRWLYDRGICPENPAKTIEPPREKHERISVFTQAEIEKLIFGFTPRAPSPQGPDEDDFAYQRRKRAQSLRPFRDSLMLGLGYQLGLRAAELSAVRLDDLAFGARGACSLSVRGKGAVDHVGMQIDWRLTALLYQFLRLREAERISHPALFCPLAPRKGSEAVGITPGRFRQILAARVAAVGIVPGRRKISPHILRYSLGTHLHEAKLVLPEIQVVLRHKDPETTMRYIRLGSAKSIQKRAMSLLPWNLRKGMDVDDEEEP